MPSTGSIVLGLSLSANAVEALDSRASRERQKRAADKRFASKKVSLAPVPSVDADKINPKVLARRIDMERDAEERAARRPSAFVMPKGIKITGVYEEARADGTTATVAYQDATPERLNQANVGEGVMVVGGVRQIADPFTMLFNDGQLHPDAKTAERLFQAGVQYRRYHDAAGLTGVKAMDLTRDVVDGGLGNDGCALSDHQLDARRKLKEAAAAIGPRYLPFLVSVVIEGIPAKRLVGYVDESRSDRFSLTIAMERLRESLQRLCDIWNIRTNDRAQPIAVSIGAGNDRQFERRAHKGA